MRRSMIGLCALGLLAVAQPASAAWNNVFQPTLFNRTRPVQVTQYYAPPVVAQYPPVVAGSSPCDTCQPPPTTNCTTNYVQRCYYQPVTVMTTQTYYEPVTTYKTSYYYEPVTSYRYSYYYDPCTCGYQQVATPCTSYSLKAQTCPVQSYVQRCCQVPVTTYQKSCYWQPQTTCCTTTPGTPIPITPGTSAPPLIQQQVGPPPGTSAPSITPPGVFEQKTPGTGMGNPMYDKLYPPGQPKAPMMPPASLKQPLPSPPPVKLEGIVQGPESRLEGQVVHADNSPRANAKLMFVSAQGGQRVFATANSAGRFTVNLASGNWNVYLYAADDLPVYNTQLPINGAQPGIYTLVSR